ncbi:MAG TPA: xanthine dehydrogenase family protein molybdopterin-binding subunit [Saprospiraceae bacterium]|nr:xanthine dehydrogenase family protein molybdopterin-binding subunit [Saprospiraceae bacterium]HPG07787.1 xanthine dehydrogenase family protein molybdopterin-binding subunit [Saprospiraceae bacterium]HQU53876.1 xanthine dehydrogenase family protein molybdopterin-binding subunit [Saprospiraceae bacterium]HRV84476.1 xanthine dehydrogenase family protein molybdopterin-binding subunit [Saprospiraceae bacterium]
MDTRKEKFPYGIPDHNLTEIEREIPADEPPAWPVNDQLQEVGKRRIRVDARAKVTGEAKYTSDIRLPGMLYAKILTAKVPHASIRNINTQEAEKLPGVHAVHILRNEDNSYPDVKYVGQPVAAVAADSLDIARQATRMIQVDYLEKPFVIDVEQAMKPEAPLVFDAPIARQADGGDVGVVHDGSKGQGNLRGPSTSSFFGGPRGDLEAGFSQADVIVEQTYRTQVQTHVPLETHGVVIDWKPEGMTVYASTQSTKDVRDELADYFDLPKSRVRVICEFMGGGFGAKHSTSPYGPVAAILSQKTGRPVWLMLERKEEHLMAGNRPNSIHYLKIGAKKDGTLTAIQQRSHGTAGVALGAGVGRVAQILYECPNFATEQYDVLTFAGPGAAWRAPGNVQGAFGVEQAIDELAEKLNLNPLAYRDKIDQSEVRKVLRQRGAKQFDWSRWKPAGSSTGTIRKGLGVAQSTWPRFVDLDSTVEVKIYRDGAVEVRSGVQDIGTGTKTIMAQIVAEEFGLKTADVIVRIGDTIFPDAPGSGGSKVTGSITPPTRNAAYKAKMELFKQIAQQWQTDATKLVASNGMILHKDDASKKVSLKEALQRMRTGQITASASRSDDYGGFAQPWGLAHGHLGSVQFAEVTVNTDTGMVKVDRIVAAHSCGRPINLTQIESQINGGVIQGVSYALYEDRVMDEATGHMMNPDVDRYQIAYSMEIPAIEPIIVEEYPALSSTDAYGIGEPANIATAAAVANAVYNAIGMRMYEIPITPARILKALNHLDQ